MNSEKVKEIKKKLKEHYCYLDQAYSDHLAYGGKGDEETAEEIYLLRDVIDYINDLESENERLTTENVNFYGSKMEAIEDLAETITKQKARIAELEHKCEDCAGCTQWKCDCANIESHALTQFAERMKEKLEEYRLENEYFTKHEPNGNLWQMNASVFCIEVIQDGGLVDETLKEFLGK